jgi:hypothetical protein
MGTQREKYLLTFNAPKKIIEALARHIQFLLFETTKCVAKKRHKLERSKRKTPHAGCFSREPKRRCEINAL